MMKCYKNEMRVLAFVSYLISKRERFPLSLF